jgi:hypothetical protein
MKRADQIRNWLGIFFLGTTAVLGAYIILLQETRLLPISAEDASSAFKIIIPTLIAQLTVVFKWIASPSAGMSQRVNIPTWAVVAPPLIVDAILIITIGFLIFDQGQSDGGEIFKNVVTFCVSLLSASTVFIVTAMFPSAPATATGLQPGRRRREP